jgi:hypothetical protein
MPLYRPQGYPLVQCLFYPRYGPSTVWDLDSKPFIRGMICPSYYTTRVHALRGPSTRSSRACPDFTSHFGNLPLPYGWNPSVPWLSLDVPLSGPPWRLRSVRGFRLIMPRGTPSSPDRPCSGPSRRRALLIGPRVAHQGARALPPKSPIGINK